MRRGPEPTRSFPLAPSPLGRGASPPFYFECPFPSLPFPLSSGQKLDVSFLPFPTSLRPLSRHGKRQGERRD